MDEHGGKYLAVRHATDMTSGTTGGSDFEAADPGARALGHDFHPVAHTQRADNPYAVHRCSSSLPPGEMSTGPATVRIDPGGPILERSRPFGCRKLGPAP